MRKHLFPFVKSMLEFPGGREIDGIKRVGKCVGKVCGKRPGSCNEAVKKAKMGAEMNSIDIVILVFIMFEKSKIALKNRNLFDIIYKGKLRDEVIYSIANRDAVL